MADGLRKKGRRAVAVQADVAKRADVEPMVDKVWKDLGALEYRECAGDDLVHKMGGLFPKMTKLKKNETVVFSWIRYKSKGQRNRVNAKVMKDPRMDAMAKGGPMPFEMKRMSMGGFKSIVEL